MSSRSKRIITTCSLVVLCISHQPSNAHQEHDKHGARSQATNFWTSLQFTSSTLPAKLKVEMFLDSTITQGTFSALATDPPDGSTTIEHRLRLTVDFAVQSVFLGETRYRGSTIFNETTLHPYQRIRVMDNGMEKWAKVYYWQENGVRRDKVLPANDREENHSPEKWTRRIVSFYPYPPNSDNCETVSDPSVLQEVSWQSGDALNEVPE